MNTPVDSFMVKVVRKSGHENYYIIEGVVTHIQAIQKTIEILTDGHFSIISPEVVEIKVSKLIVNAKYWQVKFPESPM